MVCRGDQLSAAATSALHRRELKFQRPRQSLGGRLFGGHDVLGVSIGAQWVTLDPVMSVPLVTWPIMTLSIILCILSIILTLSVLLHKSRGGGLSDLFGGGVSTSMGGTSVAERNLDRITIIVGLIWVACIVGLLFLYRYS